MLFVTQEERRARDTVLFTSENNDIANQSVDTSFFTSEKNGMTNQLASLVRREYFYGDTFWRVNLGMYIYSNTLYTKYAEIAVGNLHNDCKKCWTLTYLNVKRHSQKTW